MALPIPTVPYLPLTDSSNITLPANSGSRLGHILASESRLIQVMVRAAIQRGLIADQPVVDYLTNHRLCEYEPYASAETSRNDEPLFTRGRWKRVVEHKTFGVGTPLYRKQLDNGSFAVVVKYGDIERTLVIECGRWITPIEALLRVKTLKVKKFTFRDGSPDKMDKVGYVPYIYYREPACLRRVEPRFNHVTPEDVAWAERQSAFPRSHRSESARLAHEKKLFADIKEWLKKDNKVREDSWRLQEIERTNDALEISAEKQLTCAQRRYVTVCRMFRKGTISKSGVQETKEHLARLLKQEQPEDALCLVRHYVRHSADELSFVRQQDLTLATDSCL